LGIVVPKPGRLSEKEMFFEGRLFVGHFTCLYYDVSSPGQGITATGICCFQGHGIRSFSGIGVGRAFKRGCAAITKRPIPGRRGVGRCIRE